MAVREWVIEIAVWNRSSWRSASSGKVMAGTRPASSSLKAKPSQPSLRAPQSTVLQAAYSILTMSFPYNVAMARQNISSSSLGTLELPTDNFCGHHINL